MIYTLVYQPSVNDKTINFIFAANLKNAILR